MGGNTENVLVAFHLNGKNCHILLQLANIFCVLMSQRRHNCWEDLDCIITLL